METETKTETQIKIPEQMESPTRSTSVRKKHNSVVRLFLKGLILVLSVPLSCVLLLIVAFVFSLGLASVIVATVVALPLLLLSLVVVRLLQFLRHADDYDNLSQLKFLIRSWIFISVGFLLIGLGVFFAISTKVNALKNVVLIGVPLTSWVKIACMICGIHLLSYALFLFTYAISVTSQCFGVSEAVAEVIDCLLFLWAKSMVMNRVPHFRGHKMLGLYTHKWIEVTIFVIIGYNSIALFNHIILLCLRKFVSPKLDSTIDTKSTGNLLFEKFLCRNYLVFCVNRLRSDITFILTSLLILLTWVLYFGSHLTEADRAKHVLEFGTWTCISLLIFSILWLMKTVTLLIWEAHAIYNRLASKILESGKQLYFLGIISRHKYDIFSLKYETIAERQGVQGDEQAYKKEEDTFLLSLLPSVATPMTKEPLFQTIFKEAGESDSDEWEQESINPRCAKKLSSKKREKIRRHLLLENHTPTLFDIEKVGIHLLMTNKVMSEEMNVRHILESCCGNGNVMENFKQLIDGKNNINVVQGSTEASIEEITENTKNEKSHFDALLTHLDFPEDKSPENLGRWMERLRNNCVLLGNTIKSAKEVADCLNKLTSWFLVGATFIMWLLVTGLATTTILVIIASPLLAATFIFGDTCKSLFQGIMFVFVVHPFDVGDLCFIDSKLMEVKAIGIWTTTFSKIDKVGTQDEVMYPNSQLMSQIIINHKTGFDCSDYIEFSPGDVDDKKIKELEIQINGYLNPKDDETRFTSTSHSVAVITAENSIKIAVRLEHKMDLNGKTSFERLKAKEEQRSAFILFVQNLMKDKGASGIMAALVHPGPLNTEVLTLQQHHRSQSVWEGEPPTPLRCRSHLQIHGDFVVDPRVVDFLRGTQFFGIHRLSKLVFDANLITALVERWRQETHTFHLTVGEATITLEDVQVLLGLKVNGDVVTGPLSGSWRDCVLELLGSDPGDIVMKGSALKLSWLKKTFSSCPPDANDEILAHYVRAYLLFLFGTVLFPDKSGGEVQLIYLPLLRDLSRIDNYSWGSAVVASLYRNLCRASKRGAHDVGGCLILLQLWAYERITIRQPTIRCLQLPLPHPSANPLGPQHELRVDPLGCRWLRVSQQRPEATSLSVYREQLDSMTHSHFVWQPYTPHILFFLPESCQGAREDWSVWAPLICFDIVEWYFPDRVSRQFGWKQEIPTPCDTSTALHAIDKRGNHSTCWKTKHQRYILDWENRGQRRVGGVDCDNTVLDHHDPYMVWYRERTRRFISPLHLSQLHQFQSHSGHIQLLTEAMEKVHMKCDKELRTMVAECPPHFRSMVTEIRDLTSQSLQQTGFEHLLQAPQVQDDDDIEETTPLARYPRRARHSQTLSPLMEGDTPTSSTSRRPRQSKKKRT